MDLKNKITVIQNLLSANKFTQAIHNCKKLINQYPNLAYIYNLCGLAYQGNREMFKSIDLFAKALSIEPSNLSAKNNIANSYKHINENDKAEEIYKSIISQDPNNIKALNNYANLKKKINDFEEAKNLLIQALGVNEKEPNILFSLAECFQSIGEIDLAITYAKKVLEISPNNPLVLKFLSGIVNNKKDQSNLIQMKNLLNSEQFNNFNSDQKINLYFGLGKAYDDLNDVENSFKYLEKANLLKTNQSNYNFDNDEKLLKNIIKVFNDIEINKFKKKEDGKKIIFICGMPRSGTTLVEQMIASHSEVNGAGELEYLQGLVKKNFFEDSKLIKQKILDQSLFEKNTLSETYKNLINFHKFDKDIITDKAPQNFIWLGFIKLFFPNSKIIYCSRNPYDNCLSLYKNYFPSNDMLWSFDQRNIAKYYNLHLKLVNFWKSKFADSIFEANYEAIVNEPEIEVKKMISFCKLNWEPACLEFYKNKKTPIKTVSVNQARKPIYKSSINSNQAYSKYLKEMFDILDTKN